jgi:hypothetical protein
MHLVHLTARAVPPRAPFSDPLHAAWFWERARDAFPRGLANVLMPNHPHLFVVVEDPARARVTFARLIGALAQRMGIARGLFEPIPGVQVVEGRDKVLRLVRYILLNPCRARLCRDPLEWLWSTARDLVGAVANPWIRLEGLVDALGPGPRISLAGFHRFVSSDACVAVQGTPLPRPVVSSACPARPLHHIVQAAAVATRAPASLIAQHGDTRQLLVALARDQGWRGSADLGELVSLSARSVARLVASCDPALVEAGRMCLGDDRLLYPRPHDAAGLREPHDPHALSALHASGW